MARNIKEYWFNSSGNPKHDINTIIKKYPNNISAVLNEMHSIAMGKRDLKGEWIIYAIKENKKYYLCLATHNEAEKNDLNIYNRLIPCFKEFPELGSD